MDRGEKLALVGESGAGKSTLLHLLGGLDRPTDGAIYFDQNDICQLPPRELAEFRNPGAGALSGRFTPLLAEFTALENVMMPLLIRRSKPAGAGGARIDGEIGRGGIARSWHRTAPENYPAGSSKEVVLARALVGDPKVLLADEPTTAASISVRAK